MKNKIQSALGVPLILLAITANANAATTAADDFSSNSLTGGTGDWLTDWSNTDSSGTTTALNASSGSLAVMMSRASSGLGSASAHRQYSGNTTDSLRVQFDYTLHTFPNGGGATNLDQINLWGSWDERTATSGSGNNSWIFQTRQRDDDSPWVNDTWVVVDGNNPPDNGLSGDVDTGVAATIGDTFRFIIDESPVSGSYELTIDNLDDAAAAVDVGTFYYRQLPASGDRYLNFGSVQSGPTTASFTIDNVSVGAIPEPGSTLLAGISLMALLRRRR